MRICVFALLVKAAGPVPLLLLSHLPFTCTSEPDHILICARPQCPVEWVDAEHPLFLLYTSGSTGKPKGVVHATGERCYTAFTLLSHCFWQNHWLRVANLSVVHATGEQASQTI